MPQLSLGISAGSNGCVTGATRRRRAVRVVPRARSPKESLNSAQVPIPAQIDSHSSRNSLVRTPPSPHQHTHTVQRQPLLRRKPRVPPTDRWRPSQSSRHIFVVRENLVSLTQASASGTHFAADFDASCTGVRFPRSAVYRRYSLNFPHILCTLQQLIDFLR